MALPDPSGLLAAARGDTGQAAGLRKSLEALREHSQEPALREMADDVLSGRSTLAAATARPEVFAPMQEASRTFFQQWEQMSQQEQDALVLQGEAELAALRSASDDA